MSYLFQALVAFAFFVNGITCGFAQSVTTSRKSILEDIQIIDAGIDTCDVNNSEQHSLFVDFTLPINVSERVIIRDGWLWNIYADISANGEINGRLSGFIQGTLDQWSLGLDGSGTATIDVGIPITGRNRRGRTRRFGYLDATIQISISDRVTLKSMCSDEHHDDVGIVTSPPIVNVTLVSLRSRYTGPLSIFPRIRRAVQNRMRSAFRQNIHQQIGAGVTNYQSKKTDLIGQLISRLPEGCFCVLAEIAEPSASEIVGR